MTISAGIVKELRDKTGVGMMDCKKALEETNGNIEEAIKILREKGLSKAAKKSDRSVKEGRVITFVNNKTAVILELNCETDFVANNNNFLDLGQKIASSISKENVSDIESIKKLSVNGVTIDQLLSDAILKLGENIVIGQYKKQSTRGSLANYEHSNGKIGVIIEFSTEVDSDIGRDIAMQVAAMNPPYISKDQVPTDDLKNEKEILKQQALAEGKPEQVVEKIVEGRISKFYKENCLIEQVFVKDNDKKISDLLPKDSTILTCHRFSLGDN